MIQTRERQTCGKLRLYSIKPKGDGTTKKMPSFFTRKNRPGNIRTNSLDIQSEEDTMNAEIYKTMSSKFGGNSNDDEDESESILEEISRVQHHQKNQNKKKLYGSVSQSTSLIPQNNAIETPGEILRPNNPQHKLLRRAIFSNACFTTLSIFLLLSCIILPTIPFNRFIDTSTMYYVTTFIIVFLPVSVVLFITTIIGMLTFKIKREYIKSLHIAYICSLVFLIFMDIISVCIMFITTEPNYHFDSYMAVTISTVAVNFVLIIWSILMIAVTVVRMKRESFEYQYGH